MAGQLIRKMKISAIRSGLEVSARLSDWGLLRSLRGRGVVFTLHRVRPFMARAFAPNRHLEITPDFLEDAILTLKQAGYRFLAVDQIRDALAQPAPGAPFAAFTLDDGFRDNVEFALPVFERHDVPFMIFACQGFSERSHTMWWETAAEAIATGTSITIETDHGPSTLACGTHAEKCRAFDAISAMIASGNEADAVDRLNAAAYACGIDPYAIVAENIMDAGELRRAASHPLLSLGAHTVSHRGLARLADETVLHEMNHSADYLGVITGKRAKFFAYPYGDARSATERTAAYAQWAGIDLAFSTRPGTLSDASLERPHLLPRISLNGHYQTGRYVRALASGIPSRLLSR